MAGLTRDEKREITEQIEDFVDSLLGNVEPGKLEMVGEFLKKVVEDHVDYLVAMQQQILA